MTTTKIKIEPITSLHEIIIRRLNRDFKIHRIGNAVMATADLGREKQSVEGGFFYPLYKVLSVRSDDTGFHAQIYVRGLFKRPHWLKWKTTQRDFQTFDAKTFDQLIKQVRAAS